MKTQGKVWIFFDSEKKKQSKPMSIVQAQITLLSLKNRDIKKYFIWTPGWDEWACIQDFLESDQQYFTLTQPPKPHQMETASGVTSHSVKSHHKPDPKTSVIEYDGPFTLVKLSDGPAKDSDYGYFFKDFNAADLDLSKIYKIKPGKKSSVEASEIKAPQSAGAHKLKIEVILISKNNSFRTHSRLISLCETLLEEEIPKAYLKHPFDLIIANPFESDPKKARLLFKAKIVGNMDNPRHLTFIEQDEKMTAQLQALLSSYVEHQMKMKQAA